MKLVREYINFERGKDPKTSMEIGLVKKLARGLESLAKDPLVRQMINVYRINPSDKVGGHFPDDGNLYLEISAQEIPTKELMEEILDKHIGMEYFSDVWEDNQIFHTWRPIIKTKYDEKFGQAAALTRMYENINFERGQDPRSILGKYTPGEIIKYNFEDLDDENDDYPEYFIKFGNRHMPIAYHVVSAYGPQFKWIPAINYDVDEISKFDRNHIVPVEGWELEQLEDKIANSKEGQEILKFLKDEHHVLMKRHLYESMDFERGIAPKEALDIGTGKLIEENFEHLKRDLSPYLIDYTLEGDYLVLDVEKMDPDNEVIPIVEGYLEAWVTLEKYHQIVYDNWAEEATGDWRYEYKIKPDYVNLFHKAYKDEMPY